MSGHSMTVTWDGGVLHEPTCHEPAEAICRAVWDCGCESWFDEGVDERGPWHEPGDEMAARHYGKSGGMCTRLVSLTEGDIDEIGVGSITFPISLSYEGDGCYSWQVQS